MGTATPVKVCGGVSAKKSSLMAMPASTKIMNAKSRIIFVDLSIGLRKGVCLKKFVF